MLSHFMCTSTMVKNFHPWEIEASGLTTHIRKKAENKEYWWSVSCQVLISSGTKAHFQDESFRLNLPKASLRSMARDMSSR